MTYYYRVIHVYLLLDFCFVSGLSGFLHLARIVMLGNWFNLCEHHDWINMNIIGVQRTFKTLLQGTKPQQLGFFYLFLVLTVLSLNSIKKYSNNILQQLFLKKLLKPYLPINQCC